MSPSPRPRGILFDLGGTLLDTTDCEPQNIAHLLEWARLRGLPVTDGAATAIADARKWMWAETARTGRQKTAGEAIARAVEPLGWPVTGDFIEEATAAFFTPEILAARLYPDAQPAIGRLARVDLNLGLVSNASDHHLVQDILLRTTLLPFFDPVISSAAFGLVKPAPEIFRAVAEEWGLKPAECVMIGDELQADIAGAAAAGMQTIYVNRTAVQHDFRRADDVKPDAAVATLEEAARVLGVWIDGPRN